MTPSQQGNFVSCSTLLWLLAATYCGCVGSVDPVQPTPQVGAGTGGSQGSTSGSNGAAANGSGGVPAGTGGAATRGSSTGGSTTMGFGTGGTGTGGSDPGTGGTNSGGARADTGGASGAGGRTIVDAGTSADGAAGPSDSGTSATTWTQIYTTMLNNSAYGSNCTGSACHNPGTQKNIKLSTSMLGYTSIRGIVTPGSPTAGTLIKDLTSGSMPRGRTKMPTADLDKIKAWISAGALDN